MIVRNLTKKFSEGDEILSGISFQVDPGEFVAVVGASGSGKSTLLRCLSLRESWDSGEYIYGGKNIAKANMMEKLSLQKNWAHLGENPDINPRKTALENVLDARKRHMPVWRRVTGKSSMDEHVYGMDYLEKVGLMDKADSKGGQLSGGEKQRVVLAKALIQEAQMILADEPVKGLDPDSVDRVMHDLRAVSRSENLTIICTLHQLDLAERFATRIMGLAEGKIVLDIPARRLTMREKELILGE